MTLTQEPQDRPESDLGKGTFPVPIWTVVLLGVLAVVMLMGFVTAIVVKRVRARREDLGPISSRGSVRPGPPSSRPQPRL